MADSRDADWEWANHLVRLAMQSSVDLTLAHQLVNNSSQAPSFPSIPSSSNSSNTTTKMEKKKVLLLLDMNGTLLYRSKVSLKSTIKKGFSHNNLCYYFRPHALGKRSLLH